MRWGVEEFATVNADVVNVTVPAVVLVVVLFKGTLARSVVPSMNETVPVGVPVIELATKAVKLTRLPKVDGLADEVTVVVVMALVPEL